MGKALVISDVNFSAVALDQVDFPEVKPCTGISLSPDTLSFDTHEQTATVTATLTPSDTTDNLVWASSNENVATVNDGVVTIHGIGTAVISATCGAVTESITITQTSLKSQRTIYPNTSRILEHTASDVAEKYVVKQASGSGNTIIVQTYNENDTDLHLVNTSGNTISTDEMIRVPYGATKVKIKTTDDSVFQIYRMYKADTTSKVKLNNIERSEYIGYVENGYSSGITVEYGWAIGFRCAASNVDTSKLNYIYFE